MLPSRRSLAALPLVLLALSLPSLALAADGGALAAAMDLPSDAIVSATSSGLDNQTGVMGSLGPLTPNEGTTMAVFSTGQAPQITNGQDYDLGTTGYDPTEPSSPVHDQTLLELTLEVPEGMNSFSFDWYFLSREYPIYVGSEFNDRFTVIQESTPFDGNIVFDDGGNVVDVNNALFTVTDAVSLQGTGFWRPGGQPPENADGGATGWVTTQSPVQPGETITLRFDVHDVADGIYDSAVLVDNFAWSEAEIDDPVSGAAVQLHWASPKSGSIEGGNTIILSGRNFAPGAEVTFGELSLAPSSVTMIGADSLQVVVPPSIGGSTGLVDLEVVSQGRTAQLLGGYSYVSRSTAGLPPVLEAADPMRADLQGGTRVELTVTEAGPDLAVWFGPFEAPITEFVSPTVVAVTTPVREEPGSMVLRVTDAVGRSTGAPLPFVFEGPTDTVDPGYSHVDGGCSTAGRSGPSAAGLLFAVLGMLALGRRRRPRLGMLLIPALVLTVPLAGCSSDSGLRRADERAPVAFASIENTSETADDSEGERVSALVSVGSIVAISGMESTGLGGSTIEGSWTLKQAPPNSAAPLEQHGATGLRAQLRPDVAGTYLVELIVTDHRGLRSQPEAVVIEAIQGQMFQVGLSWNDAGNDLDLHLLAPGGGYWTETDCFFGNPQPTWGDETVATDDPSFGTDGDGTNGVPMREEIAVTAPVDGTYTVLVHHLNDRDTTDEVEATLTLIVGGVERTLPIDPEHLSQGEVWQAFAITLPSASVTPIDNVTTHADLGGPTVNERIYQTGNEDP
jgi:MYXO-CTERM domain-containing protein